jgi:prevent-host-death family protein
MKHKPEKPAKVVVTVHQAKTQLSRLLKRAEAGDEVVIARADKPVARLVPIASSRNTRGFGMWKGKFDVPDSFFDPLPEEELRAWEGRDD